MTTETLKPCCSCKWWGEAPNPCSSCKDYNKYEQGDIMAYSQDWDKQEEELMNKQSQDLQKKQEIINRVFDLKSE